MVPVPAIPERGQGRPVSQESSQTANCDRTAQSRRNQNPRVIEDYQCAVQSRFGKCTRVALTVSAGAVDMQHVGDNVESEEQVVSRGERREIGDNSMIRTSA
jgi:hypothetical protein